MLEETVMKDQIKVITMTVRPSSNRRLLLQKRESHELPTCFRMEMTRP